MDITTTATTDQHWHGSRHPAISARIQRRSGHEKRAITPISSDIDTLSGAGREQGRILRPLPIPVCAVQALQIWHHNAADKKTGPGQCCLGAGRYGCAGGIALQRLAVDAQRHRDIAARRIGVGANLMGTGDQRTRRLRRQIEGHRQRHAECKAAGGLV